MVLKGMFPDATVPDPVTGAISCLRTHYNKHLNNTDYIGLQESLFHIEIRQNEDFCVMCMDVVVPLLKQAFPSAPLTFKKLKYGSFVANMLWSDKKDAFFNL
jgi:hypothetical protein